MSKVEKLLKAEKPAERAKRKCERTRGPKALTRELKN